MEEATTIRVVPFDGKQSSWRMWSRTFMALARKKGWHGILTGDTPIPDESETLDETSDSGKKAIVL